MNVLVAAFDVALFLVAVVVLGLEVPYWGTARSMDFVFTSSFAGPGW
jgi:hypothetical protein